MSDNQIWPEPTVGALIENAQGKVFLAKSPKWNNKWVIPGGHVDVGERIEDAVVREVKEETGLDVTPVHMLAVKDAIYPSGFHKKKHFVFIDYLCKQVGGDVKLDGRELTEHMWVRPEDALEKLDVDEYSADIIRIFLKLKCFSKEVAEDSLNRAKL